MVLFKDIYIMNKNFTECRTKLITNRQINDARISFAIGAKNKYWEQNRTITISFIGGTTPQINLVKKCIDELMEFVNLKFTYLPNKADRVDRGDVRISFVAGDGSWSYLGTDALYISKQQATMNFGWLHKTFPTDVGTIKHELTHMIGAKHEHQFPKGITFILDEIKKDLPHWSDSDIIHNIIRQANPKEIDSTKEIDLNSIMLYAFPARWNKERISTRQNTDWSKLDRAFWSSIYPKKENNVFKDLIKKVYSDKNIFKLLKNTHKEVADILNISTEGKEQTIIKNIKDELFKN